MSENLDKAMTFPAPQGEDAHRAEAPKFGDPERRCQTRYPFNADVEMFEPRSRTRLSGRCSDLGQGGCYVDTLTPFAVGAEVRIRIKRDAHELEAVAIVTYAHPSLGMGLKFTEMKREHQEVLHTWIAELSGGPAASDPPAAENEVDAAPGDTNLLLALNELIALLARKKVLTDKEAADLLRKVFR